MWRCEPDSMERESRWLWRDSLSQIYRSLKTTSSIDASMKTLISPLYARVNRVSSQQNKRWETHGCMKCHASHQILRTHKRHELCSVTHVSLCYFQISCKQKLTTIISLLQIWQEKSTLKVPNGNPLGVGNLFFWESQKSLIFKNVFLWEPYNTFIL